MHTICVINWIIFGIIFFVSLFRRKLSSFFNYTIVSLFIIGFIAIFLNIINIYECDFSKDLGITSYWRLYYFLFKNFGGLIPIIALIAGAHGSIKDDEERARRNFIDYWKNHK